MFYKILQLMVAMSVILLTACASNSAIEQNKEMVRIEARETTASVNTQNKTEDNHGWQLTTPPVTDNAKPQREASSSASAVTSLVNQAYEEYIGERYSRAIALAERGLRINRRSPELYLILAQCYWKQLLPTQSKQFAQKGLRYSRKDSEIYGLLSNLLGQ